MNQKKGNSNYERKYNNRKEKLLAGEGICTPNSELYREFLEWEEIKLKRRNNLMKLDESCYKTLYGYLVFIKNVNTWFKNKPLKELEKKDIERVYNDLEEGRLLNAKGTPFKSRKDYYNKIFKSKLFYMAGKDDLTREIMEFYKPSGNNEVKFITEEDFRVMLEGMYQPEHKLLAWLAFDIGENINSLLRLRKNDFYRQEGELKEPEYRINLKADIIKRSRTSRAEITNYKETTQLLDRLLPNIKDNDLIFKFDYWNAKKIINRALERNPIKCTPNGEKPTWKDLRSGMACDLLKKGWTTDEVNARLGHRPSSSEIDKYVNFLAINRHETKKKMISTQLSKLQEELDQTKENEKLKQRRLEELQLKVQNMEFTMKKFEEAQKFLTLVKKKGLLTE